MVSQAEQTNQTQVETPEAKAAREFTDNLTKVTDAVKAPETADTIANVLDSNFQKGLKALATTPEGKAQLNTLAIDIAAQLKKTPIDAADKKTLEAIQTLITPLIMETSTTKFDKKFTTEATAGTLEKYNTTKDKGLEKVGTMLTALTEPAYTDLPGKENIIAALTTPTKTNVAALQAFLERNINNADAKTGLIDRSKKGGTWDGKYGEKTDIALNAYLTEYKQFVATENGTTAQKTAAEEAANAVITSTENINTLNTSKATAKQKLDEAFATYKETDYTPTNWKTLTDAKTTGQKSIDDATTADGATNGQTTAEAVMKSIPTKTQETKTNTEKIDKTQNVLTKLQDSPAFKNLPNNIQRQVNRILNLTKRDDKVDAKIAESQKEVTNIENQIAKFNADNVNKAQESLSITNTITIMKSQNIQSQQLEQLEQQQAELTTAMENNITKIASLKSELVAPQARLERLQNRDERIEGRLEDKFTDIANVLQTEINKRTAVINQLDNSQVVAALTKEIATITEVKNNIKTLQDANASLAQLNNPVAPTDQTAVTEQITATELAAMTEIERNTYTKGLKTLDKDYAAELAKLDGPLYLDGLPTLDKYTAAELAKLPDGLLSLNGLTKIDKDIATELAQLKGPLYLSGLPTLDKDTAAELAKLPNGTLFLDGLTTLDDSAAVELAQLPSDRLYFGSSGVKNLVDIARSQQA